MTAPKLNDCDPSDCINPYNTEVFYRYWSLVLLRAIYLGVNGSVPPASTVLPQVTKAYTFFTNAYKALGFVDGSKKIGYINFNNQTDADIIVSFDGVTPAVTVSAGSEKQINFTAATEELTVTTDVYAKYSQAPTQGNFIIEGWY